MTTLWVPAASPEAWIGSLCCKYVAQLYVIGLTSWSVVLRLSAWVRPTFIEIVNPSFSPGLFQLPVGTLSQFGSCSSFVRPSSSPGERQTAYWFLSQLYQEWHYEPSTSYTPPSVSPPWHALHIPSLSLLQPHVSSIFHLFLLCSLFYFPLSEHHPRFLPFLIRASPSPPTCSSWCNSPFTRIWLVLEY